MLAHWESGIFKQASRQRTQSASVDGFRVPLAEVASIWFENPASISFGSQFVYRRGFTEESGTDAIASISVTLSNSLGISDPVSITF